MGETLHEREDPVRANHYSRQARRAAHCIKARNPGDREPTMAAIGPDGDELAQVAARIAEELDLSPDVIDDLLWGPATPGGDVHGR
jgi:hypothetical protein